MIKSILHLNCLPFFLLLLPFVIFEGKSTNCCQNSFACFYETLLEVFFQKIIWYLCIILYSWNHSLTPLCSMDGATGRDPSHQDRSVFSEQRCIDLHWHYPLRGPANYPWQHNIHSRTLDLLSVGVNYTMGGRVITLLTTWLFFSLHISVD